MFFCFPEVTSLANGPAKTPDSGAARRHQTRCRTVTVPPTSSITSWLTALGTMSTMCQFHLPQLKIKKHSEQQGEPDDGHELNLTALKKKKKHIDFHYGAFLSGYDASRFSLCGTLLCALRWFSSRRSPPLKSAFLVSVLIG